MLARQKGAGLDVAGMDLVAQDDENLMVERRAKLRIKARTTLARRGHGTRHSLILTGGQSLSPIRGYLLKMSAVSSV